MYRFSEKDGLGIAYVGEVKAIGGHGLASSAAVMGKDSSAHLVERHRSASDLEKRAYDGSNHVAEESVGLDSKNVCHVFSW